MMRSQFKKLAAGFLLGGFLLTGALAGVGYSQARASTTNAGVVTIRQIISGALTFASGTSIKNANGTSAAPSYTFASDPDTGIYSPGVDSLGITLGGTQYYGLNGADLRLRNTMAFSWSSGSPGLAADLFLYREGANWGMQRNSTSAQRFGIANTYTSSINNETFAVDWQTIANVALVGTRTAATGTARDLAVAAQTLNGGNEYSFVYSRGNSFPFFEVAHTTAGGSNVARSLTGNVNQFGSFTSSATSGSVNYFAIQPTYNQASGTAANTDLLINRTETAVGSGAQYLIDAQVGAVSKFSVSRTGQGTFASGITAGADVNVGAGSQLYWNARNIMASAANGLWKTTNFQETFGVELNVGTAAPTVTSCGTGTVTSGSRNVAGEITATGATACTITFGAPNWTNTPFCTITEENALLSTPYVSAKSTTAITVSGLTANDVFVYHCIGRI